MLLDLARTRCQGDDGARRITELQQPVFPSIGSLLNPETGDAQSPISSAIGIHGRVTMEIPNAPAKIALMYNMCMFLRWLISPTKRNYYAMPDYLRPVEAQLTVPHPVWIDLVPWPEARSRIIRQMDWSQFLVFRALSNQNLSINWPHGQTNVFETRSKTEIRLSSLFETHIRDIAHWSVGPELALTFPFLDVIPTRPIAATELCIHC